MGAIKFFLDKISCWWYFIVCIVNYKKEYFRAGVRLDLIGNPVYAGAVPPLWGRAISQYATEDIHPWEGVKERWRRARRTACLIITISATALEPASDGKAILQRLALPVNTFPDSAFYDGIRVLLFAENFCPVYTARLHFAGWVFFLPFCYGFGELIKFLEEVMRIWNDCFIGCCRW